jgi:hypothetical protein
MTSVIMDAAENSLHLFLSRERSISEVTRIEREFKVISVGGGNGEESDMTTAALKRDSPKGMRDIT